MLLTHEAASDALAAAPAPVRASLTHVFTASDFVAQSCARDPALLVQLLHCGDLERSLAPQDYLARAPSAAAASEVPEAEFQAQLRRWRRYEYVRIAWRDLAGWAQVPETLAELSACADAAITTALAWARRTLVVRYGEPRSAAGEPQPLVVLGMGKLGGGELNFSSDVDLVLLFPEHGETDGARGIANEEFFTRLGQALVAAARGADRRGVRVPRRHAPAALRRQRARWSPASPPSRITCMRHGRDWERYAYVKARPIAGIERYAEVESAAVRPFVYRRYLDFGVFESLREMKALIEREVERRELAEHVKLGPGGIREIEFIVQALQLIRGGRDRRLQTPSLLRALPLLGETRFLPLPAVEELRGAYAVPAAAGEPPADDG